MVSSGRHRLGCFISFFEDELGCEDLKRLTGVAVCSFAGGAEWGSVWGVGSGWRGPHIVPGGYLAPFLEPSSLQAGSVAGPGALVEFKTPLHRYNVSVHVCEHICAVGLWVSCVTSQPQFPHLWNGHTEAFFGWVILRI